MMSKTLQFAVFLCSLFILPFVVHSNVITVSGTVDYTIGTTGMTCSLRGAIINANADAQIDSNCPAGNGDDVIILSTDFTFSNTGADEDNGYTGDLDIHSEILIQSNDENTKRTIDANGLDRIFDLSGGSGSVLTLQNVILTNGYDNGLHGQLILASAIRSVGFSKINLAGVEIVNNVLDFSLVFEPRTAGTVFVKYNCTLFDVVFRNNHVQGLIPPNCRVAAALALLTEFVTNIHNIVLDSNTIEILPASVVVDATGGIGIFGNGDVHGTIEAYDNIGIHGGAFFIADANLEIRLTNDLHSNYAPFGGVFHHKSEAHIYVDCDYQYDIYNNSATDGGVIFGSKGSILVTRFDEIRGNIALLSGGFGFGTNMLFSIGHGRSINTNFAGVDGGFIKGTDSDVLIGFIDEIVNNVAVSEGGLVYINGQNPDAIEYEDFGIYIGNVTLIDGNEATTELAGSGIGGVVSARSANVLFKNITTISNQVAFQGGVISLINPGANSFEVVVTEIVNITGNYAGHPDGAGAFIYTKNANAEMTKISGVIADNDAHNGNGGIISTESATATFTDNTCDIINNFAFKGSLIGIEVSGTAMFSNHVGEINNNVGFFEGGLLYCGSVNSHCEMNNIHSEVRDMECGSGCLIFSVGSASLFNHVGNIDSNNAHFDGGLIYAATMNITNVEGDITNNQAEQGSGGCFYSNSSSSNSIYIASVRSIDTNFAKDNGGVFYAENGGVVINGVCSISNNIVEDGTGSVAYARGSIVSSFAQYVNNIGSDFVSVSGSVINNPYSTLSASIAIIGATETTYIAEANPSGGTGDGFQYDWNTNDDDKIAVNINLPFIYVVVTDRSYCVTNTSYQFPNPIADAGSDLSMCPAQRFTLGGSPSGQTGISGVPGPIRYDWSPYTTLIGGEASSHLANPMAFISNTTEFTLMVTDSATGLVAFDEVIVSTLPVTVDAGEDTTICAGESVILGGSPTASTPLNSVLRYTWEPIDGLSNPNVANPTVSPLKTTTYSLYVSTADCRTLDAFDSVTVTVIPVSSVYADASPNDDSDSFFICKGDSITLGGDSFGSTNETPLFYEWSPSNGLSSASIPHPIASPEVTTTYTLSVYTENYCSVDTDTVTVVVSDLDAEAGADLINSGVLGGVPTALGGSSPFTYLWIPSTGLSSSVISSPRATPVVSTTYEVIVTDSNGCSATDSVSVVVRNLDTAGYTSIRVSFLASTQYPNLNLVRAEIQETFASILDIPTLAIDIKSIDEISPDTFESNIIIYQFGPTGDVLIDSLMETFGCAANVLPCIVNPESSLMKSISWDYLEFIGPAGIDNSFSYNSVDTLSLTTYEPPVSISFTTQDDDVDLTSILTSILLDDDDDEQLSDLISGNDDDDEDEFPNVSTNEYAPGTYLSSLYVQVQRDDSSPAASIQQSLVLILPLLFMLLLVV